MQDHTLIFVRAALPIPKNNKGKLRRLNSLNSALVRSFQLSQDPRSGALLGTKGTFCIPLGPGCSAFVWPRLGAPAARPASPTTPSSLGIFLHTHHSPMTSWSGVSSPGAPSRSVQCGFFSKRPRTALASPKTARGDSGSRRGPGVGSERDRHTKPGLTPQPPHLPSAKQPAIRIGPSSRASWVLTPIPSQGRPLPQKCTPERLTAPDTVPTRTLRPLPPGKGAGPSGGLQSEHSSSLTRYLQLYYSQLLGLRTGQPPPSPPPQ